jgi:tRNA A-37 threonylcarbamoyl transferase component Bud32/tetratricopeptide (TPR) repeat protein
VPRLQGREENEASTSNAGLPMFERVGVPRTDDPHRYERTELYGEAFESSTLGRYVILRRLGSGAMGEVLLAYDPAAGRRVAIKRILQQAEKKQSVAEMHADRFVREAKALARVNHPNVVSIYDVGIDAQGPYFVMEYVAGGTLAQALHRRMWTLDAILDTFKAAGEGLAAAHAVMLVHRDFKPENVLLGDEGAVKVADFGLVGSEAIPVESLAAMPVKDVFDAGLTHGGSVLGTPTFMSPEQHRGDEIDARSDQFNFCASLYYAVFGSFPFGNENLQAIRKRCENGEIDWVFPRANLQVRPWLRAILVRGLAAAADQRFESMHALLAAIDCGRVAQRKAQRRRFAWGAALVGWGGIVGSISSLGAGIEGVPAAICSDGEALWQKTWSNGVRADLDARVQAVGRLALEKNWRTSAESLDDFRQEWLQTRSTLCERIGGQVHANPATIEASDACLARARAYVHGWISGWREQLLRPSEDLRVPGIALPILSECEDEEALRLAARLPSEPEKRQEVVAIRGELAQLEGLSDAGELELARLRLMPILEKTKQSGDLVLLADAETQQAFLESKQGRPDRAARAYDRAYLAALALHHDQQAANIATRIIFDRAYAMGRIEDAPELIGQAQAIVHVADSPPIAAARFLEYCAIISAVLGKLETSRDLFVQAGRAWVRARGTENIDVATNLSNLAIVVRDLGDRERALALNKQAVAMIRRVLGDDHAELATIGHGLIASYWELGHWREAIDESAAIVRACEKSNGDSPIICSSVKLQNAAIWAKFGQRTRAAKLAAEVAALQHAVGHRGRPSETWAEFELAQICLDWGRLIAAERAADRALWLAKNDKWPDSAQLADAHSVAGAVALELGKWPDARAFFAQAQALRDKYAITESDFDRRWRLRLLLAQGERERARLGQEHLREEFVAKHGEYHLELVDILVDLWRTKQNNGGDDGCRELRRADDLLRRVEEASPVLRLPLLRALQTCHQGAEEVARLEDSLREVLNSLTATELEDAREP